MSKVNPCAWAEQLVGNLGPEAAHRVVADVGRPLIGTDGSTKNTQVVFYKNAMAWLKKFHPLPAPKAA